MNEQAANKPALTITLRTGHES